MSTTTYRFPPVSAQAVKKVPCGVCGKVIRRQRTFTMTVNPFNRDPDTGKPRTYVQVLDAVRAQARQWEGIVTGEQCREH